MKTWLPFAIQLKGHPSFAFISYILGIPVKTFLNKWFKLKQGQLLKSMQNGLWNFKNVLPSAIASLNVIQLNLNSQTTIYILRHILKRSPISF